MITAPTKEHNSVCEKGKRKVVHSPRGGMKPQDERRSSHYESSFNSRGKEETEDVGGRSKEERRKGAYKEIRRR